MLEDSSGVDDIPLTWLADAPLFIDSYQVSAFYDAVVMPESDTDRIIISTEDMKLNRANISGKLGAKVGTSALLGAIFPFVTAHASGETARGSERQAGTEHGDTVELKPVKTPHRQLVQLALHYSADLPNRVRYITAENFYLMLDKEFALQGPRALIFLEIPPSHPIIPLAAELSNGKVVTLFE